MRFLYGLVFDLLALALLLKLLRDAGVQLLPRGMMVAAIAEVPFLLRIGGRSSLMCLRVGVGIASPTPFPASPPPQSRSTRLIILTVSLLIHLWARRSPQRCLLRIHQQIPVYMV